MYKLNYGVPTVRTLNNKKSLAQLLSRKKGKNNIEIKSNYNTHHIYMQTKTTSSEISKI